MRIKKWAREKGVNSDPVRGKKGIKTHATNNKIIVEREPRVTEVYLKTSDQKYGGISLISRPSDARHPKMNSDS